MVRVEPEPEALADKVGAVVEYEVEDDVAVTMAAIRPDGVR
jgi:hypothetical protein